MEPLEFSEALRTGIGFVFRRISRQYWPHPSYYDYGRTPRPDHGILLVLHGEALFQCGNTSLLVKEGGMVFLPKGSRYKVIFQGSADHTDDILLNFDWENAPALDAPVRIAGGTSPDCVELFERLLREKSAPDVSPLRTTGVFHLLLDAISNSTAPHNTVKRELLQKALELLDGEEELPICEVARACCMSESGMRKLFHDVLGTSPVRYRLQKRINRAKYLLEASDLSVKEVAAGLGFYDEAYFCKLFRTYTGLTPRQYAKNKKL